MTMNILIRYSVFAHAEDGVPKPKSSTWNEFVAGLGPHRFDIPEKLRCFMFTPAEFPPGVGSRAKENVIRVWFGVMDMDGITPTQLLWLCERLGGLDAVLYTTWRHAESYQKNGLWKIRVCVRFSRPVEAAEWPTFWPAFNEFFGGLNDPQCADACRCYFGPFAPPGTPPELCHFIVFGGEALDVEQILAQASETPPPGHQKVPRERLKKIAARWKKAKDYYRSEMGDVLMHIFHGEAFAEPGNRDNLLFQLCSDLAKELPNADPESVADLFAPSLQMSGPDAPTVESVREKFERAQTNAAAEVMAKKLAEVAESKLYIRQCFAKTDPTRDYPYTEPELDAMAAKLKCSRDEMTKRWIIQRGAQFYFLGPDAVYSSGYGEKDGPNAALRELAPAITAGVELATETKTGRIHKGIYSLVREYGSVAEDLVLDLAAQEAKYEPVTKLFVEAPCPLRNLTPLYDAQVAQWLEILVPPEHHQDVLNWLAHVTDLDRTCAALVMTGDPDTGKTLFACGVARLWTENAPTELEDALGKFNSALAACPLVFADEKLPTDNRGKGRTGEIRKFISALSRPFERKFQHATKIRGAARLLIAANNDDVMAVQEHLTVGDIEAISQRFYHFRVRSEAIAFLKSPGVDPKSFVKDDRIARHVLWLRDNFAKTSVGRFIIRPKSTAFSDALTTKSQYRSEVLLWLLSYLKNPTLMNSLAMGGVRINDEKLYVKTICMLQYWTSYLEKVPAPTLWHLERTLGALSAPIRPEFADLVAAKDGTKHKSRYREIRLGALYDFAENVEFMTREEIDEALSVDTETLLASSKRPGF